MKSARDMAIDIVWEVMGGGYTRGTFVVMSKDESETGRLLARMIDATERGILADRKAIEKAAAPS